MIQTLHKAGIPVPEIIKLPDGRDYLIHNGTMYVLTTKLNGKNIVNLNECDDIWFFEFGRILVKLHIAFGECEKNISYWNNSMLEEMKEWVSRNLQEFKLEYLKQEDIKNSIDELSEFYDDLPKQLIS